MELLSGSSAASFVVGLFLILVGIVVRRTGETDHTRRGTRVVKVGVALLLLSFLLGLPDLLRGYKNGVMTQRQAEQDLTAHGRISVGNLDAIRQLSTPIGPDHQIEAPTADIHDLQTSPINSETHNPIPVSFLDENAQNAPGRTIST